MLEKLGFKKLVEETLTIHRLPRVMSIYQFLLGMVLALKIRTRNVKRIWAVQHPNMESLVTRQFIKAR